jgi:protein-S-isoprenylcysteine O-methyltransferase Ste14
MLGYAVVLLLVFHLFVTLYEEPTLQAKFGATYEQYCQSVPRWIPQIK